jgi:acyl-CoA thioesterase I
LIIKRTFSTLWHTLVIVCLLWATPPALAAPQTILVVGDSISAAYGMSLEQGWVALWARQLAQSHPDYAVVNASISGETTSGAVRRMPDLLARHSPAVVLIELGGNDGLRGYPIKSFRANLALLANQSREIGAAVVLIRMEIPPNYGSRYTSGFRDSFGLVAEATGSHLAPFLLEGIATEAGLMQGDGIHPTATAQPAMLDNVLPTLMTVLSR